MLDIDVGGISDGSGGLGVLNGLGGYGVEWPVALWLSYCGVLRRERVCLMGMVASHTTPEHKTTNRI